MGDLSKNFSKKEFKCKDGCGFDEVNPKLIEALEELRTLLCVPLQITSGCRCESHNKMVRGSPKSQHVFGNAADIRIPAGHTADSVIAAAEKVEAFNKGGIGRYKNKNIVHVDVRPSGGPSRWTL